MSSDRLCFLSAATLDSAVTMGSHGSKSFLLRDGKATVQCVYYENVRAMMTRCSMCIVAREVRLPTQKWECVRSSMSSDQHVRSKLVKISLLTMP